MTFAAPIQKKSIRFRARSFVAFTLTPEAPLEEWLAGLDHWTENSPGFFTGRPVVLDLAVLKPEPGEVHALVAQLGRRGIRVYAIEADGLDTLGGDLPPLLTGAREATAADALYLPPDQKAKETATERAEPQPSNTLLIEAPVRSGQSVLHAEGDVIILGSVASGSEIVAGGSIHVYGTLRGRAIAGATGNSEARIFCRRNEAELLAIDGWYRTAEEMDASLRGKPVQAFLDDRVLWVAPLN